MTVLRRGGLACGATVLLLLAFASPAQADPFTYDSADPAQAPLFTRIGDPIGPTRGDLDSYLTITGADPGRIVDLNVFVEFEHENLTQVDLFLRRDDLGLRRIKLMDNFPGAGLVLATFDDEATLPADPSLNGNATPPYIGTFQPVRPLSLLDGFVLDGTWRLQIEDEGYHDGGRLIRWGITGVTSSPEPGSMALLGMGLAGMAGWSKRRRRKRQQAKQA